MTIRRLRLGSILGILLRMTVYSALVLGSLSANAADVHVDGTENPGTASATQDQSPPKGVATAASPGASPSSSAQSTTRSETKKHNVKADTESALEEIVVTGTYIRGVSPASPLIVL